MIKYKVKTYFYMCVLISIALSALSGEYFKKSGIEASSIIPSINRYASASNDYPYMFGFWYTMVSLSPILIIASFFSSTPIKNNSISKNHKIIVLSAFIIFLIACYYGIYGEKPPRTIGRFESIYRSSKVGATFISSCLWCGFYYFSAYLASFIKIIYKDR